MAHKDEFKPSQAFCSFLKFPLPSFHIVLPSHLFFGLSVVIIGLLGQVSGFVCFGFGLPLDFFIPWSQMFQRWIALSTR